MQTQKQIIEDRLKVLYENLAEEEASKEPSKSYMDDLNSTIKQLEDNLTRLGDREYIVVK